MRYAREIWVQIIGQYERSGMTQEAFAAERGIPVGTLRSWIYRRRRAREDAPALLPVRVVASTAPSARPREVGGDAVEVELADGTRLRFGASTCAAQIAELVGLLRARC